MLKNMFGTVFKLLNCFVGVKMTSVNLKNIWKKTSLTWKNMNMKKYLKIIYSIRLNPPSILPPFSPSPKPCLPSQTRSCQSCLHNPLTPLGEVMVTHYASWCRFAVSRLAVFSVCSKPKWREHPAADLITDLPRLNFHFKMSNFETGCKCRRPCNIIITKYKQQHENFVYGYARN